MADGAQSVRDRLIRSVNPKEQHSLREALVADGAIEDLREAYLSNPFIRLDDEEAAQLSATTAPAELGGLIAARHAAQASTAPRHVVFCMPKSGSSFVHTALRYALELPTVTLTSFGSGRLASDMGMNGREQELDELAVIKSALRAPGGFIAQHHTRYTQYLGLQLVAYRLRPIVTVRNVLDSLVSFDDMLLEGRKATGALRAWIIDPYVLPQDYPERDPADRYALLARCLGVWQLQFLVSWKRAMRQKLVSPFLIQYERDILNPPRFVALVTQTLGLNDEQRARLQAYAQSPDRAASRLNVGQAGRGRALIPKQTCDFLLDFARCFRGELADEEIAYLLS